MFVSLFVLCFVTSSFACTIRESVQVSRVLETLQGLDQIARRNGNRASGTPGFHDSVDAILDSLARHTNLDVSLQSFSYLVHEIVGTPTLSQVGPSRNDFVYGTDFGVFSTSPSGTLQKKALTAVPNLGCTEADYASFRPGNIALVLRGSCTFVEKEALASKAGASALILYNSAGGPFNGRIDNAQIPVFSMAHWAGKLLAAGPPGTTLSLSVTTSSSEEFTTNIIAETPFGDPKKVIVVGSHLDSVPAGPGVNDNGSGTATNLELAIAASRCQFKNKVRFAWWGAEELGLLGSHFYVNNLSPQEKNEIALNLNFDMLGSPNYVYAIYNGTGAPEPIQPESAAIQKAFEKAFQAAELPFVLTPFDGRSDYGPFIQNGIPAGGLATGAEGVKTMEERTIFGGFANAWYDPCYHNECDTFENISPVALKTNLEAAAYVLDFFVNANIPPRAHVSSNFTQILEYSQSPKAIAII